MTQTPPPNLGRTIVDSLTHDPNFALLLHDNNTPFLQGTNIYDYTKSKYLGEILSSLKRFFRFEAAIASKQKDASLTATESRDLRVLSLRMHHATDDAIEAQLEYHQINRWVAKTGGLPQDAPGDLYHRLNVSAQHLANDFVELTRFVPYSSTTRATVASFLTASST